MIYFPILLESKSKEVAINKHILLKRIDCKECQDVLGIKNVEFQFDKNNCIKSTKNLKNPGQTYKYVMMPYFNDPRTQFDLLQLNFVLVVDARDKAERFQQALKLLDPNTRSGISVGFSKTGTSANIFYMHPFPYKGNKKFTLDSTGEKNLAHLIDKLDSLQNDKKLQVLLQKYLYALSSEGFSDVHRFLDLAIILELLLLPQNTQELSYRFRLRFANLFKKKTTRYSKDDIQRLYETGKTIYDIRSKIVHKGNDNRTANNLKPLVEFTQQSIMLYIENRSLFQDDALDKICLQ